MREGGFGTRLTPSLTEPCHSLYLRGIDKSVPTVRQCVPPVRGFIAGSEVGYVLQHGFTTILEFRTKNGSASRVVFPVRVYTSFGY